MTNDRKTETFQRFELYESAMVDADIEGLARDPEAEALVAQWRKDGVDSEARIERLKELYQGRQLRLGVSDRFGRSAREQAQYRKTVWSGTEVYRNKLDIRGPLELERAERMFVSQRVEQGFPAACTPYSYAGFRAMHRHMFQDIYDWAGEERANTSGRGPAPFAAPEHINGRMETQFEALDARKFHMSRSRTIFASEAAVPVNEINAAYPFIDGNGRTQRQWLRALARDIGYRLTLRSADKNRWNEDSRVGFVGSDHTPMSALLDARLEPLKRPYRPDR